MTKRKAPNDKMSPGRPSGYRHEYVEQARKLSLLGATNPELADFFDVSIQTVENWKTENPEFLDAIKEGKDIADSNVADRLYNRAMGYSHKAVKIAQNPSTGAEMVTEYTEHYPPDTAACIFWLKNRQKAKWRDKQDHEVTGKDGAPLVIEIVNYGKDSSSS